MFSRAKNRTSATLSESLIKNLRSSGTTSGRVQQVNGHHHRINQSVNFGVTNKSFDMQKEMLNEKRLNRSVRFAPRYGILADAGKRD